MDERLDVPGIKLEGYAKSLDFGTFDGLQHQLGITESTWLEELWARLWIKGVQATIGPVWQHWRELHSFAQV